jgi:hypothetical protein
MTRGVVQAVSLVGAVRILAGYAGPQYAGLRRDGVVYGLLNMVGSGLLATTAVHPFNAGVLILESVWAALSLGTSCAPGAASAGVVRGRDHRYTLAVPRKSFTRGRETGRSVPSQTRQS